MELCVKWFETLDDSRLKTAWTELQQKGNVPVFQRYDWNRMLFSQYGKRSLFGSLHSGSVIVGMLCRGEDVRLIAPLVRNGEGVYFLGWDSWSDYLDFLYAPDLTQEEFDFFLDSLCEHLRYGYFALHCIRQESPTRSMMEAHLAAREQQYPKVTRDESGCVAIDLPGTMDEYKKLLSKSTRQNLRTARNRLQKDGFSGTLHCYSPADVPPEIVKETQEIYQSRRIAAEQDAKSRLKRQLKKMTGQADHTIAQAMPLIEGGMTCTFSVTAPDGASETSAFCYGVRWGDTLLGLQVAVNMKYAKYSPGMLLFYDLIERFYETGECRRIDLTRGQEEYKYKLGGQRHDLCYYRLFPKK
ncbi:MAG: GNAT family N-acetyltransferase [Clostridiales bacterium]|nr:GNAT family N-acetyltransferase [Clostridiales bacterium]